MTGNLVVLTGASGGGKTTIANTIEGLRPDQDIFHFDSIGVPTPETIASFGTGHQPGGAWQRAMTLQWFERIAPILKTGRSVLFEGQMRVAFIQEALTLNSIPNSHVILVDCDDPIRSSRLIQDRQQPELAKEGMMGWARYLRGEAHLAGHEILDTGKTALADAVAHISAYLDSSKTESL